MPLSYESVRSMYDKLYGAGVTKKSMPEWAAEMNTTTQSQLYNEGLHDGWWTRASRAADRNVFEPVASVTTEPLFGAIGGAFGAEEAGRRVGRGLPRALLETAPLYLAGPEVGIPATAALMASHTYADTGSAKAAAISGVTGAALPLLGKFGGSAAARAFGVGEKVATETGSVVLPFAGREAAFKATTFTGSQAAQVLTNEASLYAMSKTLGEKFDPLSADFLLQQIPFTVFDAVHGFTVKPPTAESVKAAQVAPTPKVEPKYIPPPTKPEEQATVESLFQRLETLPASASPEEHVAVLKAAIDVSLDPNAAVNLKKTYGEGPSPDATVTGWGKQLENGNWKVQVDPDAARSQIPGVALADHGNVFINDPKAVPTRNPDGSLTFKTNVSKIDQRVTSPMRREEVPIDPNQLDLKVRDNPLDLDEWRTLQKAGVKVPTPVDESVQDWAKIENPHGKGVESGLKLPKESEAAVETERKAAWDETFKLQREGKDSTQEFQAAYGKATYLNGKLEGVKRSGPNYDAYVKQQQALKPIAQEVEQAHGALESAKEKVAVVPQTAEEIPNLVPVETAKLRVEELVNNGSTPAQAIETVRLQTQTPTVDEHLETLNVLRQEAEKVLSEWKGKPQAKYGDAVRDTDGNNFKTQALAEAFKESDPDLAEHVVRNAGKGKGYYLAPVLNKEVSLEGTNLEQVLAENAAFEPPVDSRPDVSIQDVIGILKRAGKRPGVMDEFLENDDIAKTLKEIQQTRTFLQSKLAGVEVKMTPELQRTVMRVTAATGEWKQQFRSYTMESSVPYDEALVKQMGVFDGGIKSTLEWYEKHPQSGPMGAFVGDLLRATDVTNVAFEHNNVAQFSYFPATSKEPARITYGNLPATEAEAFRFALNTAHELAHHAGNGILRRADPAAIQFRGSLQQGLQALETSKLIPLKVRKAIELAKKENWYEDYANFKIDSEVLHENYTKATGDEGKGWFGVFYGMQNEHELFAQMFKSRELVKVLQQTKMPTTLKESVLQFFSKAFNALFGGKVERDNVFHDIVSKFENYLQGDTIGQGYTGRDYIRDALVARGTRPEGLASRMDTIEKLFNTGDLTHSITGFEREALAQTLPATAESPSQEFRPEIRTALTEGKPTDIYQIVKGTLLAKEVPAMRELWQRLFQDVAMTRELIGNIKKGLVPGTIPEGVNERLGESFVRINALKRGLEKQEAAIDRWKNLDNFTHEGFEGTMASRLTGGRLPAAPDPPANADVAAAELGLAEIRQRTSEQELHGTGELGLLERWLAMTQFIKKKYPNAKPVIDNVQQTFADGIKRMNLLNLAKAYEPGTKTFSKTVAKSNARVASNETLSKSASDIYRIVQIREKEGKQWSFGDKDIKAILGRSGDPEAIKTEINTERARGLLWTEQLLPQSLTKINTENTAKVIASHEVGMLPSQARGVAEGIYSALAAMQDPAQAAGATELLRQLSAGVQPKTFLAAVKFAQKTVASSNNFLKLMRSRPTFVTEQRYGDHQLVMRGPLGEPFRASAQTKERLIAIQKEKMAQGYTFLEYVPKSDANAPAGGINPDVLAAMKELDVQSYNSTKAALSGVDPTIMAKVLPETQRAQQYEASSNAFRPTPGVTRRFVAGREYINMLENAQEFYTRANNWLRYRETHSTTSLDMMHPEVAGNRVLSDYLQKHVDNALTPDNPFFRKLVSAVYFQRLAFSLGNTLLESTQNLGTGMQAVIAETGSVTDAFTLWKNSVGKIIKNTGKSAKDYGSADFNWAMREAELQGVIHLSDFADIHDPDTGTVYEINQRAKNPAMRAANAVYTGARKWTTWFQRYNDKIGFLSGLELATQKGMSIEDAFRFARDLKERGYYTGGKPQRSVELWNIDTKPVPQMLSALQTYTLGWFNQMALDWKTGFGKAPEGTTETQRLGSKKAFLYGLAAQATFAGALGLPGMGQGLSLLKQATGLDLKGKLRSSLATLFDEDTENGGLLTNLALRGGLAGTTPIDPSNRAAISFPFVGIDPYKGFDISQLLGAPGASVSDAVKGMLAAAQGDWQGFQKLLPSVLKPPVQLIQGEGDVRDARGALLQKLTPAERFLTAIGLPSSRIQSARDTAEAVKNLNDAAARSRASLVDKLVETYRTQGPAQGQTQLVEHLQDHPDEDGASLVRAIATRVRRQTLPYDYRRDLNVGVDLHGLGVRMPSTEAAGRRIEYDVQRGLGLRVRPDRRADEMAMSLDALMDSNPYFSRAQASKVLEESGRVRRRSAFQSSPALQSPHQGFGYQ